MRTFILCSCLVAAALVSPSCYDRLLQESGCNRVSDQPACLKTAGWVHTTRGYQPSTHRCSELVPRVSNLMSNQDVSAALHHHHSAEDEEESRLLEIHERWIL